MAPCLWALAALAIISPVASARAEPTPLQTPNNSIGDVAENGMHLDSEFGRQAGGSRLLQQSCAVELIIDGDDAPCGRYPFMASIQNRMDMHKCGGVLIDPEWILTAAHCVDSMGIPKIVVGACNLSDREADGVEEYIQPADMGIKIHPNWMGHVRYGNDIALIKLDRQSNIRPVELADDTEFGDCTLFVTAGWGDQGMKVSGRSHLQHTTQMQFSPPERCREAWAPDVVIQDTMLCMDGGPSVCDGDSGGPLLLPHAPGGNGNDGTATEDRLVGIVSFGNGTKCETNKPGVYTRVASFREWINDEIGKVTVMQGNGSSASDPEPLPKCPLAPGACGEAPPLEKDCEEVKDLLKAPNSSPAMVYASLNDSKECCTLRMFPSDWTLLHYASENLETEPQVVECLIQGGSDVNAPTKQGHTPLHIAARWGVVQAINVLIEKGAEM